MAAMEYRASESGYVGQASDGTWVRVDESEYAETVDGAMREQHGIVMSELGDWSEVDADTLAKYDAMRAYWLEADEWAHLIGENDLVTEA